MAHPNVTKRVKNKIWHLEDEKLTLSDARALKRHLIRTEEKKAKVTHTPEGHQVWWSK